MGRNKRISNSNGNESEDSAKEKGHHAVKKQTTQETFIEDDFVAAKSVQSTKGDRCSASFGSGIILDFKQTVGTHWIAEMINFNQKTLAVSFFLFFAAIVSCNLLHSSGDCLNIIHAHCTHR